MKARRGHAKTRGKGNRQDSGKAGMKRRFVEEASDSSDEDFVVDEEEEEEEDDDNDDIMSNEEEEEEEEEESTSDEYGDETLGASKRRKTGVTTRGRGETLRKKPRNRATKRVKILSSEDEDFQPDLDSSTEDSEYDNDDEEVVVTKRSRTRRKRVRKSMNSGTRLSKKGRRTRRTPASRKVAKKQRKIAPASQKSATRQRRTIPGSQSLVRNTAGNNRNSDEDFLVPANQQAKKRRTCSSNSKRGSKLQRRRKIASSSASDFSDLDSDYTICEEDNEPLFRPVHCRQPASRLTRSSLIQKQEIVSIATDCDNQKHTSLSDCNFNKAEEGLRKKGKEKIEGSLIDGNSELGKPVCGICLSDDAKAYRGKLDCCDHYFCFACIMEWAKVESRCPMCKQRFISISKSGKGLHGRKISIPLRDQVIFSKFWLHFVAHQQLGL